MTTKLYAPAVQANWIARPRLLARLNRGLSGKLTLISAPAGFGKTTLAAAWLGQSIDPLEAIADRPGFAWLSLDEADNDPALFLSYLVAALQTVDATLGETVASLLSSPQTPTPQFVMASLINEIASWRAPLALVMDDYHVIHNRAIHDAIAYLLNHLPPRLHLVIATRADPPLPLARLRVSQEMTEVRAEDLRFTTDEAAAFLQQVWDIRILPQHVAALETRTEGWVAGLQLAALSLQRLQTETEIAQFVADFTGSHRFVLDYLADEVLRQQPPEILDFLLGTSILDRFCAELCDAILDIGNSQTLLEELEAANLFLVPLDEQRRWYRYHHLFGDLLRHRLKQGQASRVPELHRRAAGWFEAQNLTGEAIAHVLAAGDTERAAQLIEATRWEVYSRGEIATLERRLQALPQELIDRTGALALTQVWILSHAGKLDEVAAYLDQLMPGFDLAGPLDARVPASWRGELSIIQAQIAINRTHIEQAVAYCLQARQEIAPDNLILQSMVEFYLGHGYRLSGQLEAAFAAYGAAAAMGAQSSNRFLEVTALHAQGTVHELRGDLHAAAALHRAGLTQASDARGGLLPIAAFPLAGLGRVYREWHEVETAIGYLEQAVHVSHPAGLGTPLMDAVITLARLRMWQGDAVGARAALQLAESVISRRQIRVADLRLGAVAAWVALVDGDLAIAAAWADQFMAEFGEQMAGRPGDWFETEYIILARIWLAQGKLSEAWDVLARLQKAAEQAGRNGRLVEMLTLQARILAQQEQTARAVDVLARAVSLAQPGGYVRAFVEEGRPLGELLARLVLRESSARAYAQRLLAAFGAPDSITTSTTSAAAAPAPPSEATAPTPDNQSATPITQDAPVTSDLAQWLAEPLSARELEVLSLVAQGLSNREVGERLYISLPTVKKHMENIHGKLYVRSRTQAVARARELGLLN